MKITQKYKNKKCIFVRLIFLQVLIVIIYILAFNESRLPKYSEIKNVNVIVEQTNYRRSFSEYKFDIYSNGVKYTFYNSGKTSLQYSNYQLYKTISIGEAISLSYYEKTSVFGKNNFVLSAHSETRKYRNLEDYYKSIKGISTIITILFVIIEVLYIGVVVICFFMMCGKNTRKKTRKTGDGSVS